MKHPLDRPIWTALTSRQAEFAIGTSKALRYRSDVAPFIACRDDANGSLNELAQVLEGGDKAIVLQAGLCPIPAGVLQVSEAVGVQMLAPSSCSVEPAEYLEPLSEADAPEMLALAELTRPGPFRPQTHRLGQFWGIRKEGRILAMAGERMKLPGFTEVSGVCTHPDARGKGYARALSLFVTHNIMKRGERPFLHAYADNQAAIQLYESLGFTIRCEMRVQVLSS